MRALSGFCVFAAWALQVGPSAACIRASAWYVVDQATPLEATTAVPLNAPIVVHFVDSVVAGEWAPGSVAPGYSVTRATLHGAVNEVPFVLRKVELASDLPIPPYSSPALLTAFVSDIPLRPNTQYSVEVGENVEIPSPSVPPNTAWTFTTGDQMRAPLRVDGDISVSFEAGSDPHMECELPLQTLCGGPTCTQKGTDNVTKARVQLPPVVDGFSDQFLKGRLTAWDAAGDSSLLTSLVEPQLVAGEASEALLTVPLNEAGHTYVPCFEFRVSDARGDEATASWCADTAFPAPAANHDVPQLSSGRHTSSACSISSLTPGSEQRDVGALVVMLAALSLRSWRRRRSAP